MDIRRTLEQTALFSDLDDEGLARLVDRVEVAHFSAGDYLVHQGDVGDALHVICEGEFQIIRESDDGDVVLARVGAGSFVGEQALLPGGTGRRNASARAATPAIALRVGRELFQQALDTNHPLKERLQQVGEQQQRHNLLAQTQLFRSLPPDSDLGRHGEEHRFEAGETILRQGDVADRVYLLLSGSASVLRTVDGKQTLVAKVQAGQCVGELGLVSREPRAATVVADEPVLAFSIDGAHFVALHQSSPELREYVSTLEGVYRLPRRGLVTQHSGRFQDQECLTTIYHLDDGRRLVVARTVGTQVTNLQQTGAEAARVEAYRSEGTERALRLSPSGTLIGLTSVGPWDGLPEAMQLALDGARLTDAQLQRFRDGGNLAAASEEPDRLLCICMQVPHRTLREAIASGCDNLESVQRRTRCGTVCGACVPWVLEMLGGRGFTPAEVAEVIEVAPDIRSFRLRPRDGKVLAHQAGQHVVVKADIDGAPVQRAYTLTSRSGSDDFYEITVKREPKGVFSRWLFDRRGADATIHVSDPRGETYWQPNGGQVIGLVGGIGVTMGLAIWRAAQRQDCADIVHMDYSVSDPTQFAYADELRERASDRFSVKLRVTSEHGRLSADELAELAQKRPGADFFLCGPDPYLDAVSNLLRAAGVAEQRLHIEQFTHAGGPIAASAEEEEPVDLPGPSTDFLFDRSEEPHERPADRLMKATINATWRVESVLFDDWQLYGRSVNPLCYLGHKLQAAAGIDPNLPYDPFAGVAMLARGLMAQSRDVFARLDRRYGPNWDRARRARAEGRPLHPNTPDGDTFTAAPPNLKLVRFDGEHAVDTGFENSGRGLLMPFYVVRGRQALRTLLGAAPAQLDRGPLPFHYHQQSFGDWTCPHSQGRRATGLLFGPMHDNLNWKEDRERSVRVFSPRAVETLLPFMDDALRKISAQLLASFEGKTAPREVDLSALLNHIADAVFIRATFGDLDLAEFGRIGRVARSAQAATARHSNRFMLGLHFNKRALDDGNAEMRALLTQLVEAVRERERSGPLSPRQRRLPMVELILSEGSGAPFGVGRLNPLIHPSISAHETTKSFLSWSFYELLANPDLSPAVLAEIADFRATNKGTLAAPSNYNLRPHTLAHLMEIARLHVPAAAIFRWSREPGVVPPDPETGIGGFSYPANALILCSPGGANTNPRVHANATEFRPSRFFDGVSEKEPVREQGRRVWKNAQEMEAQFGLLPFGAGVGQCVGRHYNLLENFAILDTLMSHFTFELVDTGEVESQELLVYMPAPGSMMARMRPRAGAS